MNHVSYPMNVRYVAVPDVRGRHIATAPPTVHAIIKRNRGWGPPCSPCSDSSIQSTKTVWKKRQTFPNFLTLFLIRYSNGASISFRFETAISPWNKHQNTSWSKSWNQKCHFNVHAMGPIHRSRHHVEHEVDQF